jgi:hypothetical protein
VPDQLALVNVDCCSGADISPCGRYRWELRRCWDHAGPLLEFIMLNPSTADADVDDPTIRRIVGTPDKPGFARRWGYGHVVVRNLFALRATNPEALLAARGLFDAIGRGNFEYLNKVDADCTIAAWGAHAAALEWHHAGLRIKRERLFCLDTNANGSPKHPLYVPSSRTPTPWEPPR